jgi:hypothetical protein
VLVLPLAIRHAIDDLAGLVVGNVDVALFGGRHVPLGQAVAAEAREVHQVDVLLYVGVPAQVVAQPPEGGGLELGPGLVVLGSPLRVLVLCLPEI